MKVNEENNNPKLIHINKGKFRF